jgi:hypothetical protein
MFAANLGLWVFSNWNHLYVFAADRAHHIIIGILLPNLESETLNYLEQALLL